jgi:sec-independent protein translocase protein TatA
MNIGILEILVILLIIVFIFGGNRLPELGRSLGRGIRNFKEANRGSEQNNRETK